MCEDGFFYFVLRIRCMLGIFKLKGEVVSDFVDLVCWFWVLFE